jgi:hypothetical protein
VSRAQEQAAFLIGERGLTETADAEGRRIIEHAEDVGDGIRRGADDYAAEILGTLETEAVKALAGIRKGIEVLEERRAELQPGAADREVADDDGSDGSHDAPMAYDEESDSRSAAAR